jgi:glycosidase
MTEPTIPNWVPDAIFYQIFPERFCNGDSRNDPPGVVSWNDLPGRENFFGGDLQGILDRLDYLQDLGVNALYLNPIFKARTNHKYDASDYFQVDPAFGSNALLKQLIDELHLRGMHIILDGVFNHCGAEFPAFQDLLRNGQSSPYRNWFQVRSFPLTTDPLSYMTCGGSTYLPKLNQAHRPVQEFILKVARFWIEEYGIDGWRLDVPFKIPLEFWREFRQTVRQANPQAYLLGEVWREADAWIQGDIFDGVTNYRLRDLLLDYCLTYVLDAEDFAFETGMLARAHGPAAVGMANLLDSHDTTRILTSFKGDVDRLAIALTYLMTTPGAPMIYYGDEIGLLGETDPDCRRPMPWDQSRWDLRVLQTVKRLTALRSAHPALRRGKREVLFTFNGVLAYRMTLEGDDVLVVLNPREGLPNVVLTTGAQPGAWKDTQSGKVYPVRDGKLELGEAPARSAMILLPA